MKKLFTLPFFALSLTSFGQILTLDDYGFSHLYSSDSTSFWLSPEPSSFMDAQQVAQSFGGHLATFSSELENNQISEALGGINVIIGLFQDNQSVQYSEPSGGWVWVTGEPLLWTNWDATQPNNSGGGEDVGHLEINSKWNDVPWSWSGYRYVLEITLDVFGCIDELACNFLPEALVGDDSCDYMSCNCFDGTIWDEDLGGCIAMETSDSDDLDHLHNL